MAEPAVPIPHPRLELTLVEARTRFVQLVRLAGLTRQSTVVTDGGRALAAIVPIDGPQGRDDDASGSAAGWLRRIEKVRDDLRRQHAVLEQALEQVWQALDDARPPGSDRDVDALRAAHADLRRSG